MDRHTKAREDRLRRMADRQGFALVKSHRRDPDALDFGTYRIVERDTKALIYGGKKGEYGLSLDAVEEFLNRPWEE